MSRAPTVSEMDDITGDSCPVWSRCVTCESTAGLRVRIGRWPGTAGLCWTQCNVCIALGRGLPVNLDIENFLIAEHRRHLGLPEEPPQPAPWPPRLPALPVLLADPHRAADLVHLYFEGRHDDGRTPRYTGAAFERLAGGGDRPDVVDVFTADDMVAVSMLNVQVRARAALAVLGPDATRLSSLLAAIPSDVDLVDADEELVAEGSVADRLWSELVHYPGIGVVTAAALLARKRPRLIPVLDGVVRRVLGHPGTGYWTDLRAELRAEDNQLAHRLDGIRRSATLDESISIIRVFHALVWMTGQGAPSIAPEGRAVSELLFS